MSRNKVIVIGGGPAGMLCAIKAAESGAEALLLDQNEKLGKKLYITGKGRCNATNACDTEEFLRNVPRNPRFLYAALRAFSQEDLRALLRDNGCETKAERGNRVFPVSDHASDVTKALERALTRAGARVTLRARVTGIVTEGNRVRAVRLENGEELPCDCAVVATGGLSYPLTGSTGDGYRFAADAGLHTIPRVPSLIPFNSAAEWPKSLQGLSLKNVRLSAKVGGKVVYDELGEMLFTHFGYSGPLVIEMSSHLGDASLMDADVQLDLKPGLTPEQLDARLTREFAANGAKQFETVLRALLPARLAAIFPQLCGVPGDRLCGQITQKERKCAAQAMKALPLPLACARPIEEAIVTRGGVDVKELTPGTMRARKVRGLYFAGEALDVDAHTGGFNLQIAFSTGALAGYSAAREDFQINED